MTEATEQSCPDGTLDLVARDGRLVLTFREAPGEPIITVSCGYGDCEWVMEGIDAVRKRRRLDRVLRQDAVTTENRRTLFATISAKRGRLEWEIAAPFRIAGWRFDMRGDELAELATATTEAMRQEDAKP